MLTLLIVAVVIVLVIARRLAGEPIRLKQMLLIPVILAALGLRQLAAQPPTGGEIAYLALSTLLAAGLGLARGTTVAVYVRDGQAWLRYRPVTVLLWVLSVAVRVGTGLAARAAGVHLTGETTMVLVAASLLAEAAVVAPKALATGAAFAAPARGRYRR